MFRPLRFCAVALCAATLLSPAAPAKAAGDRFETAAKAAFAPLANRSVTALKVLHLSADVGRWVDTGLPLQAGDRVTVMAQGRLWLSRHHDLWLGADVGVWRRIGPQGSLSRGSRATDTFVADAAGSLQFKLMPTRWLDASGRYEGEPALLNPDAGGGFDLLVVRWSADADVAGELAQVAAAAGGFPPAADEVARLRDDPQPPAGWHYLWELGPEEIFHAETDRRDGGPRQRMTVSTEGDVGILQYDVDLPLDEDTLLQWRWNVAALPARAAETAAAAHDYISIAVEFDNGQDLTYLWSRELPVDRHFRCPLAGWADRETHWVLRSGPDDLGRWLSEARAVKSDYAQAVGGPPPARIVRVWLIANSVFGRGQGRAAFGDIRVGDADSLVRVEIGGTGA